MVTELLSKPKLLLEFEELLVIFCHIYHYQSIILMVLNDVDKSLIKIGTISLTRYITVVNSINALQAFYIIRMIFIFHNITDAISRLKCYGLVKGFTRYVIGPIWKKTLVRITMTHDKLVSRQR